MLHSERDRDDFPDTRGIKKEPRSPRSRSRDVFLDTSRIKKEPRSRSRSPIPSARQDSRRREPEYSERVRDRPSGSRDRDRGQSGRERDRPRDSKRERERYRDDTRDRERDRVRHREDFRESDRPREYARDRERPREDPTRGRDRSSSDLREPERSRDGNRERDRSRDKGQIQQERPRDGARERDWDNFFNPASEMSRKASVKREKEEQDRKAALAEGEFGKPDDPSEKPVEKEQPNFGLSGKLTEETNSFRGVVIKYSEPAEARKPNKIRWRFYPFKGEEALPVMHLHRQSAYLLGRDRKVADIPVDHPSCSKQHAVLQYRLVPYVRADGSKGRRIRPYIIDLESANGTYVNGNRIDAKRYVELFERDVLKFGFSSREYVLLHDESKDVEDDYADLTPD